MVIKKLIIHVYFKEKKEFSQRVYSLVYKKIENESRVSVPVENEVSFKNSKRQSSI